MNTKARSVPLVCTLLVAAGVVFASTAWAGPQRHERSVEHARHGGSGYERHDRDEHRRHDGGPWRGIRGAHDRRDGHGGHHRGHDRKHGRKHGHHHGRNYPPHYGYPPRHHGPPACHDYRHRHMGHHFHDHYGQPHFYFGLRTRDGGFVIYN